MSAVLTPADLVALAQAAHPCKPFVMAANTAMLPFVVLLKRGDRTRDWFPVMGTGKVAVQKQHEGLCRDGEQCVVLTPEEWAQRVDRAMEAAKATHHERADARALDVQVRRNEALQK